MHRANMPMPATLSYLRSNNIDNINMDSYSWRCVIYTAKLYALPVCDITGRYRESSARFYRDNPAQVHRLIPFINRDVSAILRNSNSNSVSNVIESINNSLPLMNISSPAFRRRVRPYLGANTGHFIHELNNFARSPYDMLGYDRVVHYMPQNFENSVIEFSSSSSSLSTFSDDDMQVAQRSADVEANNTPTTATADTRVESTNNTNINTTTTTTTTTTSTSSQSTETNNGNGEYASFQITTTADGIEVSGISMVGQAAAINLSTHNRAAEPPPPARNDGNNVEIIELDDDANENERIEETAVHEVPDDEPPRHAEPTITDNIDLATSSSSDCEFVLARKPPHLRTPELVSLNSESDSDVVFVNEVKTQTTNANVNENDKKLIVNASEEKKVGSSPSNRRRAGGYDGLYMGASTSTGLRRVERKRKTRLTANQRTTLSLPDVNENVNKFPARVSSNSNSSSNSSSSSSSSSSSESDDSDEDFQVLRKKKRNNKQCKGKVVKGKGKRNNKKIDNKPNNKVRRKRRQTRNDRDSGSATLQKKRKLTHKKAKKGELTTSDEEELENLKELKAKLEALKKKQDPENKSNEKDTNEKIATDDSSNSSEGSEENSDLSLNSITSSLLLVRTPSGKGYSSTSTNSFTSGSGGSTASAYRNWRSSVSVNLGPARNHDRFVQEIDDILNSDNFARNDDDESTIEDKNDIKLIVTGEETSSTEEEVEKAAEINVEMEKVEEGSESEAAVAEETLEVNLFDNEINAAIEEASFAFDPPEQAAGSEAGSNDTAEEVNPPLIRYSDGEADSNETLLLNGFGSYEERFEQP